MAGSGKKRKPDESGGPGHRPEVYVLEDVAQLKALVSPLRRRLIGLLSASGPLSVGEIAERVGRAPDSLYYHVKALEKVGLVVRRGSRPTARRPEALYDLVADRAITPKESEQADSPWNGPLGEIVKIDFEILTRRFCDGLRNPDAVKNGPGQDLSVGVHDARLSRQGVRRINKLLTELQTALIEESARGRGASYQFGYLMAEVLDESGEG